MEEKEAKRVSLELMKVVQDAYLSTVDSDGFPQTRVMGNLRNKEQCRIAEIKGHLRISTNLLHLIR